MIIIYGRDYYNLNNFDTWHLEQLAPYDDPQIRLIKIMPTGDMSYTLQRSIALPFGTCMDALAKELNFYIDNSARIFDMDMHIKKYNK